jgi:hypothetical protein
LDDFAQVRGEFPNAKVFASTYDNFVKQLATVKSQLPVITEEIGDTWIHGVQSDPLRVAQFRMILRLRRECLKSGQCDPKDPRIQNFNRLLIKVTEHTWGLDVKTFLHDV